MFSVQKFVISKISLTFNHNLPLGWDVSVGVCLFELLQATGSTCMKLDAINYHLGISVLIEFVTSS